MEDRERLEALMHSVKTALDRHDMFTRSTLQTDKKLLADDMKALKQHMQLLKKAGYKPAEPPQKPNQGGFFA